MIEDFKTIASTALFLFVASLVFILAAFYDLTHYVIKKLFLANL